MGREVVVAITNGRFDDSAELVEVFGPWGQIFGASQNGWHVSLDGGRRKRVLVKIIEEERRIWVLFRHLAPQEHQRAEGVNLAGSIKVLRGLTSVFPV